MGIDENGCPDELARLLEAATCLTQYLDRYGRNNQKYDVLRFLAEATIARLQEGKEAAFKNLAIQDAVSAGSNKDPSAWLSPIWTEVTKTILPKIEGGIQEFARANGFAHYPWAERRESTGGAGNFALYFLVARPLPDVEVTYAPKIKLPEPDITYIQLESLTPSWWARWLFNKGYSAEGWRRMVILGGVSAGLIATVLVAYLIFVLLSQTQTAFSAQHLVLIAVMGFAAWYAKHFSDSLTRLFEDRIVMAPDLLVGFKEFGVCLEFTRPAGSDRIVPRGFRLVKYAAECPICGAEVLLDSGKPEFPRRIVGRCQESPREHVFSFDQVRKVGNRVT